jgi:hypothetical protein
MHPVVDPRDAIFGKGTRTQASRPLQWILALLADQELYKRVHIALEEAETSLSGVSNRDFILEKTRQIRQESESRASIMRTLAASTLLTVLRRLFDVHTEWPEDRAHGSLRSIFVEVASVFRVRAATMEPKFVKPSSPSLALYAAEIIRLLLHRASQPLPDPFKLRDDAALAILQLKGTHSSTPASLPVMLTPQEVETFVAEFVDTIMRLNLTLPPDPDAKHSPATLAEEGGDDIFLGCDSVFDTAIGQTKKSPVVPKEVSRVLAQSVECLRWNAALSLYTIGADLATVCRSGFEACILKYRQRKEHARLLLIRDLMMRALQP